MKERGMIFAIKTTARELHKCTELDRIAYEEYYKTRVSNYGDLGRIVANITGNLGYIDLAQDMSDKIFEEVKGTDKEVPSDLEFLNTLIIMAKEIESR